MEKISWIDRVRNGEELNSLKEERNIRYIIALRLNGLVTSYVGTAF
jgi:hypothetical protein